MEPAQWFFAKHEQEPTTEVAIRRGIGEDLYIVLAGYDAAEQSATYAVTVNPLVNWIWFGFAIMALGTGLALLPERRSRSPPRRCRPAPRRRRRSCCCCCLPGAGGRADAAGGPRRPAQAARRGDPLHLQLPPADERLPDGAELPRLDAQRAKLDTYWSSRGWTATRCSPRSSADYGTQAILAAPIDKGFNRLAWLFPYLVGVAGACAAVVIARRWSRAPADRPSPRRRQTMPRCAPDWTMSSATSINGTDAELPARPRPARRDARPSTSSGSSRAGRGTTRFSRGTSSCCCRSLAATVAVVLAREARPEHLVLISLTIGAAGFAGAALYRMLAPLVGRRRDAAGAAPLSESMRAVLEREKMLVLRSIKELEFDRAMGKVSAKDFDEMAGRLRARAMSLMRQLDAEAGYRELIERELQARLSTPLARAKRPARPGSKDPGPTACGQPQRCGPGQSAACGAQRSHAVSCGAGVFRPRQLRVRHRERRRRGVLQALRSEARDGNQCMSTRFAKARKSRD